MRYLIRVPFTLVTILISASLFAQEDDFEDFDPLMFEEAGPATKAFCTNKVLGQQPTPLISVAFDYQGAADLSSSAFSNYGAGDSEFGFSSGLRLTSNIPILSRNNILINWGINFIQTNYHFGQDNLVSAFTETLRNNSIKWLNTNFTIFKPLNDRRFLLLQIAGELNGDYSFNDLPSLSNMRFPLAAIYGWKPSDDLMWGIGVAQTYIGGARNFLPVFYYYKNFANPKWGLEALLPSRIQARYRWNSRSLLMMGYQMEGASYRLENINDYDFNNPGETARFDPFELRRSEIRLGLTYSRGLNDFVWMSVQVGYRINWQFNVDDSNFFRGFDDTGYLIENELSNTVFAQVSLSLVSP
ncbi:MAG: hypothetical protein AAGC88_12315 [Bacteroidota bacterium]